MQILYLHSIISLIFSPTNVSQIDLSYDNSDQIEEFTVEFQVNSWSRGALVTADTNTEDEEEE